MRWDEWRGSMDGRPTLWVRHVLCGRGRHVDLHKMVAKDDPDCFHTHPAYAIRVILWGGYVEELEGGRHRTWRPGMVGLVKPSCCHRIAGLRNGRVSYSLWIRFRKVAKVIARGDGWAKQAQTHLAPDTIIVGGRQAGKTEQMRQQVKKAIEDGKSVIVPDAPAIDGQQERPGSA